jgi:hypothetical protein
MNGCLFAILTKPLLPAKQNEQTVRWFEKISFSALFAFHSRSPNVFENQLLSVT